MQGRGQAGVAGVAILAGPTYRQARAACAEPANNPPACQCRCLSFSALPCTCLPDAPQKQELAVALKKAGRMIDVLRRQRVHLEAAALLQVSSRELAEAMQGQQ